MSLPLLFSVIERAVPDLVGAQVGSSDKFVERLPIDRGSDVVSRVSWIKHNKWVVREFQSTRATIVVETNWPLKPAARHIIPVAPLGVFPMHGRPARNRKH